MLISKTITLISVFCLIVTSTVFGQSYLITWSENTKISSSDFEGMPSDHSQSPNHLGTFIDKSFDMKEGKIVISIIAKVNRFDSWKTDSSISSDNLAFQQGHFNITELFARKLRETVSEETFGNSFKSSADLFSKQFISNYEEMLAYQNSYEMATNHGRNLNKCNKWVNKLQNKLYEMNEYSSSSDIIIDYKRAN
ncbi:MAG: hypothetical protein HRT72_00015 [Flavobacteriales bacterium]|nr:hypothetical protein [Flavobacteriales bacterium]